MKEVQENLSLFIAEQKSYFDAVLSSNAENIKWGEKWSFGKDRKGFLTGSTESINFFQINLTRSKAMLREDEQSDKKSIIIDNLYANFIQAFLVYRIRTSAKATSPSKLNATHILLKRIYVRLVMSGIVPSPCNITSETLKSTSELLATFRKNSNLADDQTYLKTIAGILRKKQITYGEPEFAVTAKRTQRANTKKANEAEFAEEFGDDASEKLIEIHDFLNVIALRSFVSKDSEKIMLNMTLLLFVTGFRYEELAGITVDALKKLEIEDKAVCELLKKRGLHTYYLGILYQGKKGAGIRTHWVEPLAIDLVEFIFKDTLMRTQRLRKQVEIHRQQNFKTLLPLEIRDNIPNISKFDTSPEIELSEVVKYIYESTSDSIRGLRDLKSNAKNKLSKLGFEPVRVEDKGRKRKNQYYYLNQIDNFLKKIISSTRDLSKDMTFRIRDSSNGYSYDIKYEELLFISEVGSTALSYSGMIKPLATPIFREHFERYIGMNRKQNISIFARYNLRNRNGEYTYLKTHMPRHNKNTFLAIADVSEHLQAMIMGRVDISQNERYQHLAIQEKSLTTDIVSYNQVNFKTDVSPSVTSIDQIKNTGIIGLNPDLKLENAISQNTHTFTTQRDRVSFITDVMDDIDLEIFEEFSNEIAEFKDELEKKDIIQTHSDLTPLDIGSCMRKVSIIECPFNMMCQDATPCPYFTLTGRADEVLKLEVLTASIEDEITKVNFYEMKGILSPDEANEILETIGARKDNIMMLNKQCNSFERKKIKINLVEYDNKQKPVKLATLFAIEHRDNEIEKKFK